MTRRLLIALGLAVLLLPALAAGGQAPACGGPGQRACCFGEAATACKPGLGPVPLGQFPTACTFGADTCVPLAPPTPCGGEGQRACCPSEVAVLAPLCQPGLQPRGDDLALDLFVPVSGDATCGGEKISGSSTPRSTATCIKTAPDPIAEPVSGWSSTPERRGVMSGYIDMHLHLLGNMAHGGKNLVGEAAPKDPFGNLFLSPASNVNTALSPARDLLVHKNPYHGLANDTSGDGTGDGSRTEFGAPYFSGWPKWTSTTHQQTYYVWLERAWRGGLRTTTLFASHVESLCKTSLKATRETSWPLCEDSMFHIVQQLQAAYDFQNFIDGLSGGTGKGWFRIVKTPQEARDVVRSGKLAVVLGIEEVLIRGWLGEALERQGQIREASREYAVSKEVMAAVRAGGANDRRVQGFFASATARLAAALVRLGEIDRAMQEYEQARNLLEPLVKANPGDQELAYVLAETYTAEGTIAAARAERAGTRAERLAGWTAASGWFRKSLNTWSTVPHPTRISTSGFEVTLPTDVASRLARCDRALTSEGRGP